MQQPAPRNFTQELAQTATGFAQTAPVFYGLESRYEPAYQRLNLDLLLQDLLGYDVPAGSTTTTPTTTGGTVGGTEGYYGTAGPRARRALRTAYGAVPGAMPPAGPITSQPGHHPGLIELSSLQRGADISDVLRYGPEATSAFLQANPFLARSLLQLSNRTGDSPLLQALNERAMAALENGGQLSPQDIRDIEQQTRASFSQRGLLYGPGAVGAELLNRDAAQRARDQAAQAFAESVQGLNTTQTGVVSNAAQVFANTLSDPFQAILSRPARTQALPTNQLFNPVNPYSQDLYNTNFNASAAAGIQNANNQAAITGSFIKALGSAVGGAAAASDRRLKKNIRRTGDKTAERIPVVEFTYRGDDRRVRGVIAQDVEKIAPWAVTKTPSGHRIVDLKAVDVPFEVVRHTRSLSEPQRNGTRYFNRLNGRLEAAA